MYQYKGAHPCSKCDGERGNWLKGYAWTRPADNSTPWWPTNPCNVCGGTGHSLGSYTTMEEFVGRNRARLEKEKRRIEGELTRLNAMLGVE